MFGWLIFRKSIAQITFKFGDAVKASLLLWILLYASVPIVRIVFESIPLLANTEPDRSFFAKYEGWNRYLFLAVNYTIKVSIVSMIAVTWHRFILLGKHSLKFIPVLGFRTWFTYMKALVPVMIIAFALKFSIELIALLILNAINFVAEFLLTVIFVNTVIYCYVSLRIGLVLPAAAIGKPMGIFDSWRRTRNIQFSILICSILLAGISVSLYVGILHFGFRVSVLVLVSFFTGWIILMMGISALTTLYGYTVENRPLD